jgi:hypothetical protein
VQGGATVVALLPVVKPLPVAATQQREAY